MQIKYNTVNQNPISRNEEIKKQFEKGERSRGRETWLNLVSSWELTSLKARRSVANSLRASSETKSLAIPSQSMVLDALNATSTTFFDGPLIFSLHFLGCQTEGFRICKMFCFCVILSVAQGVHRVALFSLRPLCEILRRRLG
jgi:hypothetical protein